MEFRGVIKNIKMVNFWILPLSVVGLIVSAFLLYKNLRNEKLVCHLGEDCNKVVRSKWGKIFGFPNEVLGIVYYMIVIIIVVLVFYFGVNGLLSFSLETVLLYLVIAASVVYFGLIMIQFFVIKEWCEYCLASAIVTFIILGIELFA